MKPAPSERQQKGERRTYRRSQSIDNAPSINRPKMPTDRNTRASMTNIDPFAETPTDIKSRFKSSTRIKTSRRRGSMDSNAPDPPPQAFSPPSPHPPPPPSSSPFLDEQSPLGGSVTFHSGGGASARFSREKRVSPWVLDTDDSSSLDGDLDPDETVNYFFDNSKSQGPSGGNSTNNNSDNNDPYFNERLSRRNDELLEEMYRREIEQYNATAANKKKTIKKENNFYKICIAGAVSVVLIVTIVAIVMYTKENNGTATSFSDTQFELSSSSSSRHSHHNHQTILHSAKNICGAAKCCSPCFDNDPDAACPERNNEFCLQHKEECQAACQAWHEDDTLVSTTSFIGYSSLLQEVPNICNEDAMAQDPQTFIECQKLCASRMCCFASDESHNCSLENEEECHAFESCTVLHEDVDAVRDLSEVCDSANISSNEGYGNCQKFCSRRACCFLPHGFGGCYSDNPEWCQEYAVCGNLLNVEPMS